MAKFVFTMLLESMVFNKSSHLAAALGVTKFIPVIATFWAQYYTTITVVIYELS